ncbi:MAG: transposase [Candidatus Woesearchaeota archaeon]
MSFKTYIKKIIKNISQNLRVATHKLCSAIVEAARTISYVETVSNKADTLHRHIKNTDERILKRAFEFNTRKAIARMGLGKVTLAIDTTKELYYGKHAGLNARRIKYDNGTDTAFEYIVISIVDPKPLPLMALPYRQGQDKVALCKELLNYARSLRFKINCVLFDRGFYIGELIKYLSSVRLKYLIFVPQNEAMKRFISQTDSIASFCHTVKWKKNMGGWEVQTKIVVIKSKYFNQKKKQWQDCHWCFATNLRKSLYLITKYKQRWQIETDFRVHDEARIKSKSNEPIIRYFYFLTSLVLMANWEVNRIKHPKVCFKRYLKFVEQKFDREMIT